MYTSRFTNTKKYMAIENENMYITRVADHIIGYAYIYSSTKKTGMEGATR